MCRETLINSINKKGNVKLNRTIQLYLSNNYYRTLFYIKENLITIFHIILKINTEKKLPIKVIFKLYFIENTQNYNKTLLVKY